ncbi:hypothetical protein [Frondihabitans sp. PAMC 28766]|uniref:hypothetical protein n=1 Tax=Frondihabitans sp. PAMC 28766 TaxID=1795630 RepID=UPI0012FF99EC|nr:hypothetical protein [Frondihabitans sp. PAMC 28766]
MDDSVRPFQVTQADQDDVVRTYVRFMMLRQWVVWVWMGAGVLGIINGLLTSELSFVIGGIVFLVLFPLTMWSRVRRSVANLRQGFVPGGMFSTAFGYAGFTLTTPKGQQRYDYSAFRRVRIEGRWVMLLNRIAPVWTFVPAAIFPPEAVARIQGSTSGR